MISVFLSVYKALKQERPELMALMYSSQGMLAWSMHFFLINALLLWLRQDTDPAPLPPQVSSFRGTCCVPANPAAALPCCRQKADQGPLRLQAES